jgi:hypothetical protein
VPRKVVQAAEVMLRYTCAVPMSRQAPPHGARAGLPPDTFSDSAVSRQLGDKSGRWEWWYRTNIPVADQRYAEHLAKLDEPRED